MILYRIDKASGIPAYVQLVTQTKRALRLGHLAVGEKLPTAKEVVAELAINPNTVLKAYRELETEGLVEPRAGLGTFVTTSLAKPGMAETDSLREQLHQWIRSGHNAGLERDDLDALVADELDTYFRHNTNAQGDF
ncbi:GntR family transcriptional regulator [Hoyosella rhizosphaerae]|uniref:GntR family transcriptional regulator n=1 Tax=Hoyosella rhizosphaerae TaxID=1755582 RepID=A0A916XAN6_9ACTN|nr:GntR family transcriptional regulator [Hoyosella rhizosphaerae]MBN4926344.1 GntR family transcriptional regulator [Hoyosella rhizosphaerae]GGC60088.1 GntR family transcriptional regulator [Hoyosella rhizosphaerae]